MAKASPNAPRSIRQPCVLRCSRVAKREKLYEHILESLRLSPFPMKWRFEKRSRASKGTRDYPPIVVLPADPDRLPLRLEKVGIQVCVSTTEDIDPAIDQAGYVGFIRFAFEPIQDELHERMQASVGKLILICPLGSAVDQPR